MAKKKADNDSLEVSLAALEQLIEKMESGKLDLDESLKCFEQGVALTKHCQKTLSQAEQKVKILMADQQLENFQSNND